jgi:hypothetical protein
MKKQMKKWIVLAAIVVALVPAAAQEPAKTGDLGEMRNHIFVMEAALARAVDIGVKKLNQDIFNVMPGVFMLTGEARARGIFLEGYGIYFDVEVPMLRESMAWSLRMMLDQGDAATQAAIADIRKHMQGITDPAQRASLERAVNQLQRNASPAALARQGGRSDPSVSPGILMPGNVGAMAATPPRPASAPALPAAATDPDRAYTEAVTRALVDAMLDYSAPMAIGPEQWLTVGARDNEPRDSLAARDPLVEVMTMIYRIKGSDLMEYRTGKIDKAEARKRVIIGQF